VNYLYLEKIESELTGAVGEIMKSLTGTVPDITDEESDFSPGQRFAMECYSPLSMVFFLEISLPLKKELLRKILKTSWDEVLHIDRDDLFLELLNMIIQRFLTLHISPEGREGRVRFSSPQVIFDEYEDDLEVNTLDFYRLDYRLFGHPFSLVFSPLEADPGVITTG